MHKAVFLDKDGTLLEDVPYNVDPAKIRFPADWEKGLRLLQSNGYTLIVISNQPGLAKGYFAPEDLKTAEKIIMKAAREHGVDLRAFYYCPHHPDGIVERYRMDCTCRKPEPGLILDAARDHRLDLAHSWFIGDILNDIEAGRRAGCRTILIDNGNETEWLFSPQRVPHHMAADLKEAAEIICRFRKNQTD